ncbi:type II secretion system F family protein [Celeribacter litoreus]|uniref:type II secretion system F family protein n=1 Tax=Celeribacter litoreus TaxID=2876714 RepID=UPI001CCC63EA|nr:type II secretion system F family protein [Celeribacter litoreus]MCA0043927.1 type II secretion system F family protein [Celeribacter litoreus]
MLTETTVLILIFVAVLLSVFVIADRLLGRRDVAKRIERASEQKHDREDLIDKNLGSGNESIRYYLDVVKNEPANSLRMRLVQAGYFSPKALRIFNLIRLLVSLGVIAVSYIAFSVTLVGAGSFAHLVISLALGGMFFVLCSYVLERKAKKRQREFGKLFPDFMDLLLVCVDAGLGIDSALDRVTREFLVTTPDFGVQLSIVNLETRAGRPLDQALMNFAKRINVEEARTLAVLFKQSQELGASISHTLRVFSSEMREQRLIRAEEKANALPVKMLMPMALFMFPVNLVIVLVPILMTIMKMMVGLAPR